MKTLNKNVFYILIINMFMCVTLSSSYAIVITPKPRPIRDTSPNAGLSMIINEYPDNRQEVKLYDLISLEFIFNEYNNSTLPDSDISFTLYDLEYEFCDRDNHPFFKDTVDLSGRYGPGRLVVNPKVELQRDFMITIKAKLFYIKYWKIEGIQYSHDAVSTYNLSLNISAEELTTDKRNVDSRYGNYMQDLLRSQILDIGRVYSDIWLKEYQPGVDSDELLRFSRTFTPGCYANSCEKSRIYIPWLYKCDPTICGPDVTDKSLTVYGSDENPLLRSGIVMATLAIHSRYYDINDEYINSAVKIFNYFEMSEYINDQGQRTGFFLRSPWPCNNNHSPSNCKYDNKEYWPMSNDEVLGMMLGLLRLHETLQYRNPEVQLHDGKVSDIHHRIESMVDRLGTYLANNYYIIIPPLELPQNLYPGYSGLVGFQWFIQESLFAITGKWYYPNLINIFNVNSEFWKHFSKMGLICLLDDCSKLPLYYPENIKTGIIALHEIDPMERAILMIQGTGIGIAKDWMDRFNLPLLLHAFQLGMANNEYSSNAVILKEEMAIVLNGILGDPRVANVNIPKLAGALTGLGYHKKFRDFLDKYSPDWLSVKVGVGSCEYDADLYAAAISLRYDLPTYYSEINCPFTSINILGRCVSIDQIPVIGPDYICGWGECSCSGWDKPKATYYSFIYDTIVNTYQVFSPWLPVTERTNVDTVVNSHNLWSYWGKGEIWEHYNSDSFPNHDMVFGRTSQPHAGLLDETIENLGKDIDIMAQATGIDYIYPRILIHDAEVRNFASHRFNEYLPKLDAYKNMPDYREWIGYDIANRDPGTVIFNNPDVKENLYPDNVYLNDKLRACTTVPSYRAALDYGSDSTNPFYVLPCTEIPLYKEEDRYDLEPTGNDSYSTAKPLKWGLNTGLTIDRSRSNITSYPFAKYWDGKWIIKDPKIYRGYEYDYYYIDNPYLYDINVNVKFYDVVTLNGMTAEYYLHVDGSEVIKYGNSADLTLSAAGRSRHIIMVTGSVSKYSINIQKVTDSGIPTVKITADDTTATEVGTTTGQYTITRSGATDKSLTVYYTVGGTATSGEDYKKIDTSVTIPAGAIDARILVVPINDSAVENDETVVVTLSSSATYTAINNTTATVTIISEDGLPMVTISANDPIATEARKTTGQYTVTRSGATNSALTVNFSVSGTATVFNDYYGDMGTNVIIPPGAHSARITLTPIDDSVSEGNETVVVILSVGSDYNLGVKSSASVSIIDNDPIPSVQFVYSISSGAESITSVELDVVLSTISSRQVTVKYTTANGTAASDSDYYFSSGSLIFTPGENHKTISVAIINDRVVEPNEIFKVILTSPQNAIMGIRSTHSRTVLNDDFPGSIQLSSATFSAEEAERIVTITATRTGGNCGPVGVSYATSNGTALSGRDFASISDKLAWMDGETTDKILKIPIFDDSLDEPEETFTIKLSAPTGGVTLSSPSSATVMIFDNDPTPTVQFSLAASSGAESTSPAEFNVILSAASGQTVTVKYKTANSTAAAGSDYTARAGTLTFGPGQTVKTVAVPIVNNTVPEPDKTFTMTLSNPVNATLGSDAVHTFTIADEDTVGAIRLSAARYSVGEAGTQVTITAQRIGGNQRMVAAYYEIVNGTAVAGQDFGSPVGGFFWADGDRSNKVITIPIHNDTLDELDETFTVKISVIGSITIAWAAQGSPSEATVTIMDNDPAPAVRFSQPVSSAAESTTPAVIEVGLSAASAKTVMVKYATANGTAAGGEDYTKTTGTLTFDPGETLKSINVPIINDVVVEPNQIFSVLLSGPVNAVLGTPYRHVYTITDEDAGLDVLSAEAVAGTKIAPAVAEKVGDRR